MAHTWTFAIGSYIDQSQSNNKPTVFGVFDDTTSALLSMRFHWPSGERLRQRMQQLFKAILTVVNLGMQIFRQLNRLKIGLLLFDNTTN